MTIVMNVDVILADRDLEETFLQTKVLILYWYLWDLPESRAKRKWYLILQVKNQWRFQQVSNFTIAYTMLIYSYLDFVVSQWYDFSMYKDTL